VVEDIVKLGGGPESGYIEFVVVAAAGDVAARVVGGESVDAKHFAPAEDGGEERVAVDNDVCRIACAAVAPIGEGETAVGDGVDGDSVALEEVA